MAKVSDSIPEALQPEVDAAINWFNAQSPDDFYSHGHCGRRRVTRGDRREESFASCFAAAMSASKRSLTLHRTGDSFTVSFADEPPIANGTQAELDPPPGGEDRRG